ncbi:MAG: TetR/AcrR family transcriptional regulator C-terminal domain-containing protein [Clostridia bacterium]|nr:TetR/AcrR family transcriptional regulator C-terminal domain-containing protein [Clostridia bacterium]
MDEKRIDKRIQNTNMTLRRSLFALLREKSVDKITPTELCRRAGINRNTFYAHYNSARELLETMENELIAQIVDASGDTLLTGTSLDFFRSVCDTLAQRREMSTALLGEYGDEAFLEKLLRLGCGYFTAEWERQGAKIDPRDASLFFAYISQGGASLIRQWVRNGMKEKADRTAELIDRFSRACMKEITQ